MSHIRIFNINDLVSAEEYCSSWSGSIGYRERDILDGCLLLLKEMLHMLQFGIFRKTRHNDGAAVLIARIGALRLGLVNLLLFC